MPMLVETFSRRRMERATAAYSQRLAEEPARTSRRKASAFLQWLRNEPGPHVRVRDTPWNKRVGVPLIELVRACGMTTGGMGSGKAFFACQIVEGIAPTAA
jgi:hypothetical protein